jgi:hypothetical protein
MQNSTCLFLVLLKSTKFSDRNMRFYFVEIELEKAWQKVSGNIKYSGKADPLLISVLTFFKYMYHAFFTILYFTKKKCVNYCPDN